jgi:hypothetical protein
LQKRPWQELKGEVHSVRSRPLWVSQPKGQPCF